MRSKTRLIIERATLAWGGLGLLIGALTACQGISERDLLEEHPLDEVPVGCVARRVNAQRWEVSCEDAEVRTGGGEAESKMDLAAPLDEGLDQTLEELDEGTGDMTPVLPEPDMTATTEADMEPPLELDMTPSTELPCDPPLTLSAPASATLPLGLLALSASGGGGQWRFELTESPSGAILNAESGAYLAGERAGVIDEVRLIDLSCVGEASLSLRVVEGLSVAPQTATVQRGDQLQLEVTGGSGESELSVARAESGGELTGLRTYQVGDALGLDLIEARDLQTGEVIRIALTVAASAPIEVSPALTAFPVGAWARLNPRGGSGHYEISVTPPLEVEGLTLRASAPTRQRVRVTDRFTGRQTNLWVAALGSLSADIPPQNDHMNYTIIRAEHDLDGDGINDAIIGQSQADVEALNGGGVFVFLSSEANEGERYPRAPSQTFAGVGRRYEVGRGFVVADVNGDELPDLVYGARGADLGGRDSGAIYLHLGLEGGRFSEEPTQILSAGQSDDHLGASVAVCDVNGDGMLDIIGSAIFYEDRRRDPISWNEGALFVFLNNERGVSPSPDQVVPGKRWTEGAPPQRTAHLNYGFSIATGDFNGDGLCDVATSEVSWSNQAQGSVYVHAGRASDEWSLGGLSADPVIVIKSDEPLDQSNNLGRRLAAGDLTGDARSDLVISHYAADRAGPNAGAAHVFTGGALLTWDDTSDDLPRFLSPYQAEWTLEGNNWDHLSADISVIDYDGVPPQDLLVMSLYGDSSNGWDSGVLRVFLGGLEAIAEEPEITLNGPQSAFQLFESAAYLGDVDEDGTPEWLARSNRLGSSHFHYGGFFLVTAAPTEITPENPEMPEVTPGEIPPFTGSTLDPNGDEETFAMWPLSLPLNASGAQFGYDVAWIGDFNRDGHEDAIASASHASYSEPDGMSGEVNAGGVWLFEGQARGAFTQGESLGRFPGFSSWDHIKEVTSAGDFNGDGHPDFAIVIGHDERPQSWEADYWLGGAEDACPELGYDQGGVYVFLGGFEADLRPDFVFYGDIGGLVPEAIAGGFDYNGDGYSDLAIGAIRRDRSWGNDVGGVDVILGRPLSGDLTQWAGPLPRPLQVICNVDRQFSGSGASDHFGFELVGVNDLNGDGCDELAVGARLADGSGQQQQGAVYLFFGEGAVTCFDDRRGLVIESDQAYIQLGTSLDAADIDGDGLDEIAIGAPYARVDGIGFGGAWVVPGATLAQAPLAPLDELMDYASTGRANARFWLNSREELRRFVAGSSQNSEAGRGVALITRDAPQRGAVALGEVMGNSKGVNGLGGVRVFNLTEDDHFLATPDAELWGEANRPESRLSERALKASPYSQRLLIGAREGGGVGLDHGSVYILDLSGL